MRIKISLFFIFLITLTSYLLFFQKTSHEVVQRVSSPQINKENGSRESEIDESPGNASLGEQEHEDNLDINNNIQNETEFSKIDRIESVFDGIQKQWSKDVADLFLDQLSLDQNHLNKYFELKEDYENERLELFQEYHEEMVAKHGEEYVFHLTDLETSPKINELNLNYRDQLREVIGDENYTRYLELKDNFNRKIKSQDHIDYSGMEIYF